MEIPPPPIGNRVKTNSYLIFCGLNRKHVDRKPFRETTCHWEKINLWLINYENKCHLSTKAPTECTLMGGIRVGTGGEWFSGSYLLVF